MAQKERVLRGSEQDARVMAVYQALRQIPYRDERVRVAMGVLVMLGDFDLHGSMEPLSMTLRRLT